jgi:hypothetical protein
MMERPPVVSTYDSKNFKISEEPWLRSGGGEDRSNCKEAVNGSLSLKMSHILSRLHEDLGNHKCLG